MTEADLDLQGRIAVDFAAYTFEIVDYLAEKPLDPYAVILRRRDGETYHATFTTPDAIREWLEWKERNPKIDGESLCMNHFVILRRVTPESVKNTLDYLIRKGDIDYYFKHIPKPVSR